MKKRCRLPWWAALFCFLPILSQAQNMLSYHQAVRRAEQDMMENNFSRADSGFGAIFRQYGFPFAEDIRTAALCANRAGNKPHLLELAQRMLGRGFTLSSLKKSKSLFSLLQPEDWDALKSHAKESERTYQASIHRTLRKEIITMFKKDQRIRKNPLRTSLLRKKWNRIDSVNRNQIKRILRTQGYPDEHLIGRDGDAKLAPFVLLLHVVNDSSFYTDGFRDTLMQQVRAGRLHPRLFTCLEDRSVWGQHITLYASPWTAGDLPPNFIQEHKAEIDQRRRAIGLESYDEMQTKIMQYPQFFRNALF